VNLRISNLQKDFLTVRAVDRVSFEVRDGEILGLIGPNGAGKTTTIRIILNILQSDGGEVSYDGAPFSEGVRNALGYLPEERGLYQKYRLMDTIAYFAELRGLPGTEARKDAVRWLERFSLLPYQSSRVNELSKGNQQKVQFIISIIHDPSLVVLDEPFSGLDPVNQDLLKDVLLELRQKEKAIIFSTHQMDQAERLSDRLCLINKGKVLLSGPLHEIKQRYGRNTLRLDFHGDGSFLQALPGVRRALVYQNSAELELADGMTSQQIVALILPRLELSKFELVEPSLHSIFLEAVGTGAEGSAGPHKPAHIAQQAPV
jgi:ABC-2 type transport system ATP-binding protein